MQERSRRPGVAREAMLAASGRAVSPVSRDDLCSVIDACLQVYALARAREWTAVLTQWCAEQPQLSRSPAPAWCIARDPCNCRAYGGARSPRCAARAVSLRTRDGAAASGRALYSSRGSRLRASSGWRRRMATPAGWAASPNPGLPCSAWRKDGWTQRSRPARLVNAGRTGSSAAAAAAYIEVLLAMATSPRRVGVRRPRADRRQLSHRSAGGHPRAGARLGGARGGEPDRSGRVGAARLGRLGAHRGPVPLRAIQRAHRARLPGPRR